MSILKVNSIIPTAGVASGGGGGIVQVVQKVKTSAYAASIGSTETVPTGMFATITTKTDTSKVLVFVNMTLLVEGSYNGSQWKLRRNSGTDDVTVSGSSNIFVGDADGNRDQATMALQGPVQTTGALNGFSCGTQFLDTPGNAGAYTYFVTFRDTVASDNNFYLNRGYNDDNNQNQARSTSSMTLIEVSA
mgnify:CR=1 FL=1|tara:strand:- start:175 stop:744 length:570 start_codon:yes stop_codon:yes gene_type:complete